MKAWPQVRLGDACSKITDGTHHSPKNGSVGDFKYITAKNIKPGGLDLTDLTYIDAATHAEIFARCDVQRGDVLYVKDGATTGRVALNTLDEPFSLLSSVGVLRPGPRLTSHYLLYALQERSVRDRMLANVAGVAITRLTLKKLNESVIPLAPIEQQAAIVAEIEKQFSRLDEAVANLQRVKAKLQHYELAVLRAALGGLLVPTEAVLSRARGHGFESGQMLLERVAQEITSRGSSRRAANASAVPDQVVLPALPEGWAWASLASIASIKGGITVDSKRTDPTARLVPYLRVANVQRGYLDLEEVKSISARATDIEALRLQSGDVLFNEGGDRDKLGRGWIWEGQVSECIHQNHVFRARPHSPDISSKLISWWGNTFGKDYFQREGKQTTNLASINMTKLSAFPVPIPPVAEQYRIVAEADRRLSIVREVADEVDANLKRAQALRQAVLQKAFAPA